ncbi:MAG: hypothetical protein ACFFBP_05800 [Promethearchaeota archaeon]
MKSLVYNYLVEVKKYLPWWVKSDKKERIKILEQLETHIWEKAEDISELDEPTEDSVRLALAHMGSPRSIAQEYEQGKTPKVFISTELWSIYKIIILIVIANIIIFNVLYALNLVSSYIKNPVVLIPDKPLTLFDEEKISLIFLSIFNNAGLFGAIGVVTIIFFWLSKRGYYPDRVKSYKKKLKREILHEKLLKKGMPISPETGEPLKPFVNRGQNIFGAIVFILLCFLIWVNIINFRDWIVIGIFGFLMCLIALIGLIIEAILGNKHVIIHQRVLLIEGVLYMFNGVFILVGIWSKPDLMVSPIFRIVLFFVLYLAFYLFLPILFFFRWKKLEKYKVKN